MEEKGDMYDSGFRRWDIEDTGFWKETAEPIAFRNLWVSIPNLLCAFAIWLYWGMIIVRMQMIHDADPTVFAFKGWTGVALVGGAYKALLYTLPAVAGLAGATLRIPNSFVIAISGGRNVKFATTLLLVLPAMGAGLALQNPNVSFMALIVMAALSGIGGGAFASSMSNISFFFPKRMQGLSLGLNAGLGNLGVSVMQFFIPIIITFGIFGNFGGDPYLLANGKQIWIQNTGLMWVPVLAILAFLAWFLMDNLPIHQVGKAHEAIGRFLWLKLLGYAGASLAIFLLIVLDLPDLVKIFIIVAVAVSSTLFLMRFCTPKSTKDNLVDQFQIFKNKHNWIMTYLYTMTFGSFIGFCNAFPKLITDVFGYVNVAADGSPLSEVMSNPNAPDAFTYAWLGALVGSLLRPVGGWMADKWGGARVTHWDTIIMIASVFGVAYFVAAARQSPTPEDYFFPFLLLFLVLFVATGIGNGSTFRMVPIIFSKDQAGPVLGFTSAIAAYGAFLIPKIFATQIQAGSPEYALYGFAFYYVTCLGLNWWFYARKNAEIKC